MAIEKTSFYCEKCGRTMSADQFYGSNNEEKYPEGKLHQCKKCITMHVDNYNPDTYLWILQECDVPYIPDEWNKLMTTYATNKKKVTGMTILGRYLSKMKLNQYLDKRWADSATLQEIANAKIQATMKRQGYSSSEIAMTLAKGFVPIPEGQLTEPPPPPLIEPATFENAPEDYFGQQSGADNDFIDDLTDEDRTYLRLKWGKAYKPEEWVKLEQLYEEMMNSYDIQGAAHIDTLKLICKTSLKANQLIDMGDIEGYQKMSKVYDSLMKSGNFTAAQNKEKNSEFMDSIGELVEMCEKQGYIERFYIEQPNDKVDITLQDMQHYTKNLVEQETNLSNLVEQAIRQNLKEDAEEAEDNDEIVFDDEVELKDQDYADFNTFLEREGLHDLLNEESEE